MAIKMVREPSETPNINNIDDIVPMRYAYGNQNGYVIGKGNEISNTVNGLNFTVNSGRLVLQGVECDIDASGVTITIDNIATKRYYVVYLQVNLGLNTAQILSSYDTATYPTIDVGDDLTENTTGIARLPLYRFTATSGIISNVNKVVESIKYITETFIKYVKVNNATKADEAVYATTSGTAEDSFFSKITVNVDLSFGTSNQSTIGSKSITFNGSGLRIGDYWYGNLYFSASSIDSGTFSNTKIIKLTITSQEIQGIYTAGICSVKPNADDSSSMVFIDRYGQGYISSVPKIMDYIGTGTVNINFSDYCVITITGIMLKFV